MKLLDLYCGAGGASVGYERAGFNEIVGVDIVPQMDYPFTQIVGDAIEYVTKYGHLFDAIHASPPCQASSALTKGTNQGRSYPQLIPATREALNEIGVPYVIENVMGAPIRRDIILCGEMFGLGVIRHRGFEVHGFDIAQPTHVKHRGRVAGWRHGTYYDGPYFAVYGDGGGKGSIAQWRTAMGIDWTDDRKAIAEAIPPKFSEFIGAQLMAAITRKAAA